MAHQKTFLEETAVAISFKVPSEPHESPYFPFYTPSGFPCHLTEMGLVLFSLPPVSAGPWSVGGVTREQCVVLSLHSPTEN